MKKRSYGNIVTNIIRYRHNSILVRNFSLVILMIILPFVILTMLVKLNMEKTVHNEIREVNANSLTTVSKIFDNVLDKAFSFAYYMKESEAFPLLNTLSKEEMIKNYEDTYGQQMRMNMLVEEYMDSIYIYLENRDLVLYADKTSGSMKIEETDNMNDLSWMPYYKSCVEQEEYYVLGSRIKGQHYPYLLTMVVNFDKKNKRNSGAVIINWDMKVLDEYLGYEDENGKLFFVIGENEQIYYSNLKSFVNNVGELPEYVRFALQEENSSLKNAQGLNYIVSVHESQDWNCKYVLCTPIDQFESRLGDIDSFITKMVLLISVLAIAVAYIVTIHSFVPIQQIMNEIDRDDEEGQALEYEVSQKDWENFGNEVGYIADMVKQTKENNKRFRLETKKWMAKLSSAQMVALQSQINPHYLYNSLDIINWKAVELLGGHNSLSTMISTLAQFFRLGFQRTNYLVRVSEEIEHAKMYARILEEGYPDLIHIEWQVEEEIMSCEMICLTLQPLIENSINYGLRPKRYEGNIVVRGGCVNDIIYLSIEDDGVGLEAEKCVELNYELINHYDQDSPHIGIRNVNQRIKIMFGDEYGVNLTPNAGGGLKVMLLLPKRMYQDLVK